MCRAGRGSRTGIPAVVAEVEPDLNVLPNRDARVMVHNDADGGCEHCKYGCCNSIIYVRLWWYCKGEVNFMIS